MRNTSSHPHIPLWLTSVDYYSFHFCLQLYFSFVCLFVCFLSKFSSVILHFQRIKQWFVTEELASPEINVAWLYTYNYLHWQGLCLTMWTMTRLAGVAWGHTTTKPLREEVRGRWMGQQSRTEHGILVFKQITLLSIKQDCILSSKHNSTPCHSLSVPH